MEDCIAGKVTPNSIVKAVSGHKGSIGLNLRPRTSLFAIST